MVHALLVCSDDDCPTELETAGTLEQLEELACDCGCTLQAIAFCEAQPVEIRAQAPRIELRLAA